jgi:hypothetical protein
LFRAVAHIKNSSIFDCERNVCFTTTLELNRESVRQG